MIPYPVKPTRTTLTVDENTSNYMNFLVKKTPIGYGGGWRKFYFWLEKAVQYFRNDYKDIQSVFVSSGLTVKVNRKAAILHYAKKLQEEEVDLKKDGGKGKKTTSVRNIKKSIVIDNFTLQSINKTSKESKIKRDFVFMSAIKHERDAAYKMLKFEKKINKDFLGKVLCPIQKKMDLELQRYLNLTLEFMKANKIIEDFGTVTTLDFEGGLSQMESNYGLLKDFELFKETLSKFESLLEIC